MRYLQIEYKYKDLKPDTIMNYEEILQPFETEYFNKLKEEFPSLVVPTTNVVLSDDIWRDINYFYSEHGHKQHKLRPKGHDHIVKIASAGGVTKIFWSARYTGELGVKIFFQLVIENVIGEHLADKYEINKVFEFNSSVKKLTDQLLDNWLLHLVTKYKSSNIISNKDNLYDDMGELTFAFKKNIRDLHYKYQRDCNNYYFILNVILELELYIRRVLTYRTHGILFGFEEFDNEINQIIKLLDLLDNDFSMLDDLVYNQNNNLVLSLLKKCDVELYDSESFDNIGFKVSTGPKNLFPSLIDTHPRLVCFIDILGFKSLIEEYETVNNTFVLQRLKRVFDASRKAAFEIILDTFHDDVREYLEFKMFSDCITVSLPYIEFGVDIKRGFYSMAVILNVLQQIFMKEGFYLRGHITMGSYYADENMLFSGGLVEAYENESKTNFPVISVSESLIFRLREKTQYDDDLPVMDKLIVKHSFSTENNQIINPFFTFESYKNIDVEIGKAFDDSVKVLGKKMKDIFTDALRMQGLDLQKELVNELIAIKEKLNEHYYAQLSIYDDLEISLKERIIASKVIEKYRFLYALISWYEGSSDDRFEYLIDKIHHDENT